MTTAADSPDLDHLVRRFADAWTRLAEPPLAESLLADPVLVLGAEGTAPVPRDVFLAAVASRSDAAESAAPKTALTSVAVQALGDRIVLATLSWTFHHGDASVTLVSDFLLQREGLDRLRCVAYLPRTNVMDHLG